MNGNKKSTTRKSAMTLAGGEREWDPSGVGGPAEISGEPDSILGEMPGTTDSPSDTNIPPLPEQEPSDADIRLRAHALWEEAGRPEGDHERHWLAAEQELRGPKEG